VTVTAAYYCVVTG